MEILTYTSLGFEGKIVNVETDIRRGIPGFEVVGLPDGAVREARDRVRVALKNCGFTFPQDRILVNLAPADVRKEGASFDLPIAISILFSSDQIQLKPGLESRSLMIMGELQLSGRVRGVRGVLPAVSAASRENPGLSLVPFENIREARALREGVVFGIKNLQEAAAVLAGNCPPSFRRIAQDEVDGEPGEEGQFEDFSDIRGQPFLRRALEVAAAGHHHVFIFGPPGCGKTMAARRVPSIMPPLSRKDAVAVTKIYSLGGKLPDGRGLLKHPPFRVPHHTASSEGVIGGGRLGRPGEISFAHKGVLLLDEAPEFRSNLLQALREPLEEKTIHVARAGYNYWFPADFQLIMTANPCPCGNLGRENGVCLCSTREIHHYWKKLGSALLDRIDIRIPVRPVPAEKILSSPGEKSEAVRHRVRAACLIQDKRYESFPFSRNSALPPNLLMEYCRIEKPTRLIFQKAVEKLYLSSRACHSILKVARTIADLDGEQTISSSHLLEAIQHRRYGENDYFWNPL